MMATRPLYRLQIKKEQEINKSVEGEALWISTGPDSASGL
jgi:hypothetical protein